MGKPGPRATMPVLVRGRVFANVRECAEHFGLSVGTVYCALSRGKADSIGLGKGTQPGCRSGKGNAKAVKLGNTIFRSKREADRALGLFPGATARILASGSEKRMQRLMRLAMEYEAKLQKERLKNERKANHTSGAAHDEQQHRRRAG